MQVSAVIFECSEHSLATATELWRTMAKNVIASCKYAKR